jgi:hypothetical protein
MRRATDEAIERAFAAGEILRTHVLRPTWHFVAPADIRWMLELTGPRVKATIASYARNVSLDEVTFKRSQKVIERTLRGGRHVTRSALRQALQRAGIPTDGIRAVLMLMRAGARWPDLQRTPRRQGIHLRPARRSGAEEPGAHTR